MVLYNIVANYLLFRHDTDVMYYNQMEAEQQNLVHYDWIRILLPHIEPIFQLKKDQILNLMAMGHPLAFIVPVLAA